MNGQRVLQRLSSIQRLFYLMDESQLQYSSCIHKYIRFNFMISHSSMVLQPYLRVERSRWWGYRVCDLALEVWGQLHQLEVVQRAVSPSRHFLADVKVNYLWEQPPTLSLLGSCAIN